MMPRRRIRIALAGAALALLVVLAALAGWLLPEARPAAAHTFDLEASSVTITSNPGADGTYEAGDQITLQVLFNRCIYNTSSGAIAVTIGENTRSATGNGNHSSTVTFSYTVVAGDLDSDGISVAANALSGTWNITPARLCATSDGPPHSHPSPALPNTLASAQAGHKVIVDYDTDDDNLIDITTLAQLNAIRHDLDGNGAPTSGGTTAYNAAFPNRVTSATGRMGCAGTCAGYELMADLDFDTDGDDDVADAPYANWVPIGIYTSTFQGNGHTISNLTVTGNPDPAGLFWELSSSGSITGVGLINPSVSSGAEEGYIGGLVGINNGGTISASYVSGGSVASSGQDAFTGGLVGINIGTIRASYSPPPSPAAAVPAGWSASTISPIAIPAAAQSSPATPPPAPLPEPVPGTASRAAPP